MNYRILGKTEYRVSEIGFGAWAIGADWGSVSDDEAYTALRAAIAEGVNFIDTADVYGDGLSERRIARLVKDYPAEQIYVATKAGRRLNPHSASGYSYINLSGFVERSLKNLELSTLDLLQLHCPPSEVYRRDDTFAALDKLKQEGLIRQYGVSVETVEEARLAMNYEGVASIQIIYNMFRLKPALELFDLARANNVGIIARVPLASGLLSGKMTKTRVFDAKDHRNYNRYGDAFDVGETFSGVDFETGLELAEELKKLVPEGKTLAQFALKWILMHPAVSTVIPGAKNAEQALANAQATDLEPIKPAAMQEVRRLYDAHISPHLHHKW